MTLRDQIKQYMAQPTARYCACCLETLTRGELESRQDDLCETCGTDFDAARKTLLAADADDAIDAIKRLHNCGEALIGEYGDVWIANPQRGHWIPADNLIDTVRAISQ